MNKKKFVIQNFQK